MVAFDHKETIEEAKVRFAAHANGEKIIPADLRSVGYNAVLSTGDSTVFESMLKV